MDSVFIQTLQNKIDWLNYVIFDFKWIYFDLWSLVTLWSGALLFVIISALKIKKRWHVLLSLLVIAQIAQDTYPNTVPDMYWLTKLISTANDLSIGMLGGFLMYSFFNWNKGRRYSLWLATFMSAITIAFIWVGTYGYSYNIAFFNSPAINWWAFTCWTLSGAIMLTAYQLFKRKMRPIFAAFTIWAIYIAILFTLEYLAFHVFTFQEATQGTTALIFDVIHGRPEMHVFYTTSTFIFVSMFATLSTIFKRYDRVALPA